MHELKVEPQLLYDFGYYRRPAYQYGRELSPKLLTMGIWKPVWLFAFYNVRFDYIWIRTRSISVETREDYTNHTKAMLSIAAVLRGNRTRVVTELELVIRVNGVEESFRPKFYHQPTLFYNLTISDARLWWPRNMGEPYQYELEFEVLAFGSIVETRKVMYGIRTISVANPETFFMLNVNQYTVYAKGAVYVPRDMLYPRLTNANFKPGYSLKELMDDLEDSNINMVRVWGGGVYETDEFYEECSKRGIMVYQDFMFSVGPYPDHLAFL